MEVFTLLPDVGPGSEPGGGPGGGDCAPPGPLSLVLIPLAVGIDDVVPVPPEVCVSRVAGGSGLCACFFLPKRNDIVAPACQEGSAPPSQSRMVWNEARVAICQD